MPHIRGLMAQCRSCIRGAEPDSHMEKLLTMLEFRLFCLTGADSEVTISRHFHRYMAVSRTREFAKFRTRMFGHPDIRLHIPFCCYFPNSWNKCCETMPRSSVPVSSRAGPVGCTVWLLTWSTHGTHKTARRVHLSTHWCRMVGGQCGWTTLRGPNPRDWWFKLVGWPWQSIRARWNR